LDLSQLAARLAGSTKGEPKQLAARAWTLYWECCKLIQEDYLKVQPQLEFDARCDDAQDHFDAPPAGADAPIIPAPKQFPVPYDKVERLLLPQSSGKTAGRAQLFREYLFTELMANAFVLWPKPRACSYWELRRSQPNDLGQLRENLKETISERFGQLRRRVFDEPQYTRFAVAFLQWHRRYKSEKRSEAARKRWAKWEALRKQAPTKNQTANNQKKI
jgi:hypothetical protein